MRLPPEEKWPALAAVLLAALVTLAAVVLLLTGHGNPPGRAFP